ncbi:hypothetical protein [Rhodoferax saidenbachensis]|uniref:Lysophospholipase L1 biosynthesis ABC-type transport system permease subunit n=1 Tax=Rhodoferax saidenbachensis TaxID=1484693 RepID=A0ABU1ZS14_9BURK|nr:hypothetical protein [Rhodoferax saidenbachensis]MDR7308349.1 putative lysophospholipase L1 biosynthesis ABC-type transport system permease subunit [Rhodoferax saidenbachensis]
MTFFFKYALVLIAASALSTGAMAQRVYKCGSSYSQIPCPGGVALQAGDGRTAAQRAAADKTTREQAAQAKELEKIRQKDDAQATAVSKPAKAEAKPVKDKAATAKKKSKEPEYFTAKGVAEPKK